MGSVRRISLVGRHDRAQSGDGFGVVPSLPGPSGVGEGFFNGSWGWFKRAVPSPLPYSLPPLPTSGSQFVIATS